MTSYTDSKGSDDYNIGLSRRRAAAVAAALRAELGGAAPPLRTRGRARRIPSPRHAGSSGPTIRVDALATGASR